MKRNVEFKYELGQVVYWLVKKWSFGTLISVSMCKGKIVTCISASTAKRTEKFYEVSSTHIKRWGHSKYETYSDCMRVAEADIYTDSKQAAADMALYGTDKEIQVVKQKIEGTELVLREYKDRYQYYIRKVADASKSIAENEEKLRKFKAELEKLEAKKK